MNGGLPDFLIAGFQKCGTTALYHALDAHPEICGPVHPPEDPADAVEFPKELAFFGNNFEHGLDWYARRFDRGQRLKFEATPYYTAAPHLLKRMAQTLPEAKIILMLRDPVARAYSAWNHWCQLSGEEQERWEMPDPKGDFLTNLRHQTPNQDSRSFWGLVGMGLYAPQIEALRQHYPEDRILTVFSDDLYQCPEECVRRIQAFLGVTPMALPVAVHHRRKYEAPMPPGAEAYLRDFYAPWDQRLEELLSTSLPWSIGFSSR